MTTHVWLRGFEFGERTRDAIIDADGNLGRPSNILQGSYHPGVGASAGTHDLDGAVDLSEVGDAQIKAYRAIGWAMWRRLALPGVWGPHNHGILIGTVELAWLARTQVSAYYAGRDGLADNGPDNTPWLRPNPIPVYPMNGQPPKPPPSPHTWPAWDAWPGAENTGWGAGQLSLANLKMQAALAVRGYAGAFPVVITREWNKAAAAALTRWQSRHVEGGTNFTAAAWDVFGLLPTINHSQFNRSVFADGHVSWESMIVQCLLILQGHAYQLDLRAERQWRPHAVTAVRAFQKAHHLTVDGIVGPITWNALWETHA